MKNGIKMEMKQGFLLHSALLVSLLYKNKYHNNTKISQKWLFYSNTRNWCQHWNDVESNVKKIREKKE